jgi:NADH-quinone oxidoreductase subunit A|tara:strand:- start:16277 stop:16519 length:243 start_codon:yes stop_codon:yes gene_type:complete
MINLEYSPVLIFLLFAFGLSAVIVLASYALGVKKPDSEKSNVYECGFSPYSDSRSQFEVRFFLVGILFIIFDLEISFLFP